MKRTDFPEWVNLRFTIKSLRLLMERQATHSEAPRTQEANSGSSLEPQIKTWGQRFQNAGDHFPSNTAPFVGGSTSQVPWGILARI